MSRKGIRTLIFCIIVLLFTYGLGAYIVFGAETECHQDPPDCPECPTCPTCPEPKPCPKPRPCPPQKETCCKISMEFILDGQHYYDMARPAVPHRGDIIVFDETTRGEVLSVYWVAGEKHAQIWCKTSDDKADLFPITKSPGCDMTVQFVLDGLLESERRHCDAPPVGDVVIFPERKGYIEAVYWHTNSRRVTVICSSTPSTSDSIQEAEVEQSASGCFINSIMD